MRLQTENRRKSQMSMSGISLDLGSTTVLQQPPSSPHHSQTQTPSQNQGTPKRASFAPLTGHRRIASVSDAGPPSPNSLFGSGDSHTAGRRAPLLLGGRGHDDGEREREVEALRAELVRTRAQLEEARGELGEVQEGREASEMCVRALRTFIEENSVGMVAPGSVPAGGVGAIGTPGMNQGPGGGQGHRQGEAKAGSGKWGFGFWKVDTGASGTTDGRARSESSAASPASAGGGGGVGTTPVAPFAKIGALFGSRAAATTSTTSTDQTSPGTVNSSVSTTSSSSSRHGDALRMVHQEPMLNGSDTSESSSVGEEPASPFAGDGEEMERERHGLMFPEDVKDGFEEAGAGVGVY